MQEGAGPLFRNTPAYPGCSGRLRRIAPRPRPTFGRRREDGLTHSGKALAYGYRGLCFSDGRRMSVAARRDRGAGVHPATRRRLMQALALTVALIVGATILVPLFYVVLGGFRTTGQLAAQPVALPQPWIIHNYTDILVSATFWHNIANSSFIAVVATLLVVGSGALAAYPLARFEFPGRGALYGLFVFGLLFPAGAAALPIYLMLRQLNLLDQLLGVALPEAAF